MCVCAFFGKGKKRPRERERLFSTFFFKKIFIKLIHCHIEILSAGGSITFRQSINTHVAECIIILGNAGWLEESIKVLWKGI